jgi:hypothetical protein
MKTYKIIVAFDTPNATEFTDWLKEQGHDAIVGDSTGNFIDYKWTSQNDDANEIMVRLWEDFCNNN